MLFEKSLSRVPWCGPSKCPLVGETEFQGRFGMSEMWQKGTVEQVLHSACLGSRLRVVFPLGPVDAQELICAYTWDEQPGVLAPLDLYTSTKV